MLRDRGAKTIGHLPSILHKKGWSILIYKSSELIYMQSYA